MIAAEKPGGLCNTHPRATSGGSVATEVGIDTWRLCRYLDSDSELQKACDLCPRGTYGEAIAGHRVGVSPGPRMLWLEGHPAVEGLAAPAALAAAEDRLLAAVQEHGFGIGRDGGISRLDQTVTLRFADPREGLVFLEGMANVDLPRMKPSRIGRPHLPETVYLLNEISGRKVARIYDKGLEARTAQRGELIRLENQTRYRKEARMASRTHTEHPQIAGQTFARRFAPVAESAEGLSAGTVDVLADELRDRLNDGRMTHRQIERAAGFLISGGEGYPKRTRERRRRELRDHGLVLAHPFSDPIRVDLGAALESALEAWSS